MSFSNSAFRDSRLSKCSLMISNLAACSRVIYPSMGVLIQGVYPSWNHGLKIQYQKKYHQDF